MIIIIMNVTIILIMFNSAIKINNMLAIKTDLATI